MRLSFASLLFFCISAQANECLTYSGDVVLRGMLIRRTFPEQPNYESIAKGDAKATYFFVSLHEPFCVSEGKMSDGLEPEEPEVKQVQLVFLDPKISYRKLLPSLGKDVVCSGSFYHAETGHHHSPVLLWNAKCRPTHHSTGPARKAAQAGEFRRRTSASQKHEGRLRVGCGSSLKSQPVIRAEFKAYDR
jgi:Domain of unknown function (DUF4431)